jgi:hypothetical protein
VEGKDLRRGKNNGSRHKGEAEAWKSKSGLG